jgi:hypothetical protein
MKTLKLEPVVIAEQIYKAIIELSKEGQRSDALILKKAEAMRDYDKARAIATIKLMDAGKPATLIPKLADGEVSEQLYNRIIAEETMKAHYSKLERLEAQLNGLQSMNRYLATVTTGENNG